MADETANVDGRGIGLNEVVYTATAPLDDEYEARYEVRYTGRSGDGTLHFRVRRAVVGVKRRDGSGCAVPLIPGIPREWECVVPIADDGTATARWSFGDDPELCRIEHYEVGEANDLFRVQSASDKARKGRVGFRQGETAD